MVDTCTKSLEKFVDLDTCLKLIDELNSPVVVGENVDDQKVRSDTERLVELFRKTIDKYQEQPELLEPQVPNLIEKLTENLADIKNLPNRYHTTFKFLYQLIKVVGFKAVGRRFPHETNKLPLIVELLAREDPQDRLNWQTRFVLIVWLSIVILAPFDLAKFDTGSSENEVKLSDKIYSTLLKSLSLHDSAQHVTAFCLARLFSRPDMLRDDKNLSDFIRMALDELKNVKTSTTSSMDDVKLIGYLRTLAYLFKFLPRAELKKRSPAHLEVTSSVDIEKINRELVNHMIIKLVQRMGMALLPKRVASWRHKRGARILGKQAAQGQAASVVPASEHYREEGEHSGGGGGPSAEELAEELESAEAIESIVNLLMVAAQNNHTKIRWSAAKGVARLANRLSRERASDVCDILLANFFDPTESSEFAWHGGCLALAEMARQGLILEEKLERVVDIVSRSIIYDKIKGSFAVGAHVREAACYVFWAMSRTYEDHLLAPYIEQISINLLCTMLFDRELQCRRAASATFQELVGRQGTFNEEGISILTSVDYQSVGVRQLAYLDLATQVARFGRKYYEPFIGHLIDKKLGHWDIQIRRLASDSLAALMLYAHQGDDGDYISGQVFGPIQRMCEQSLDNNAKHGALLGLAKCVRSLKNLEYKFEPELVQLIGGMALRCSKQLASKQQAPNFIEAIGGLILAAEVAQFGGNYTEEILKQWETIILQALDSDNGDLRQVGAEALLSMYRYFYSANKTCQDRLLSVLNKSLASPNESTRCGALRALSKLGLALRRETFNCVAAEIAQEQQQQQQQTNNNIKADGDTPDIILMSLTSYLSRPTCDPKTDTVFAHAMAEACEALVNFIKSLDKSRLIISSHWLRAGLEVLLEKSQDYTFDKRGDIGVVVRRSAVRGLKELTLYLLSIGYSSPLLETVAEVRELVAGSSEDTPPPSEDNLVVVGRRAEATTTTTTMLAKIAAKILQQAVSYNQSAREQAALAFYQLVVATLTSPLPDTCLPHRAEILKLFEQFQVLDDGESFNWRDDSTPIFVSLLVKSDYARDIWIGLMPALGQASDLCARQFRHAFKHFIQSLDTKQRQQILNCFLETLEQPQLAGRLLTSGLIVADYLLTQGLLLESASAEFQLRFARLCWKSRGQGDPKRAISVAQVMCSMLQFSQPQVQLECLRNSLSLLISGYSKVRVFTAAELYTALLTYQSELEATLASKLSEESGGKGEPANVEEAMELLSQTNWSEPLDKVRPIRDEICFHLLVQP